MKRTSAVTSKSNINRLSVLAFEICLILLFLYQTNVTIAVDGAANVSGSAASDVMRKPADGNLKSSGSQVSKSDKKVTSNSFVTKSNSANPSSIAQDHPLYEVSNAAEELRTYVNTKINNQMSKEMLTNQLIRLNSEISKAASIMDKDQEKTLNRVSTPPDGPRSRYDMPKPDEPVSKTLSWLSFLSSLVAVLLILGLIVAVLKGRKKNKRSEDEGNQHKEIWSALPSTVSDTHWDIINIKGLLRNIESKINELGPPINYKKIEQKVTPIDQQIMPQKGGKELSSGRRSTIEEMIELYNSQSEDDFRTRYENIIVLGVLNSRERKDKSDITPIFDTDSSPSLWGIQSEGDKMIVFPRIGIDLNSAPNILAYAIDAIYDWNGNPTNNYRIIKPAIFVKAGSGWKVEKKGEIEFY